MKKVMKNVLLTCVAASAMVIAMATTAMAAESVTVDTTGGLDVSYADGKVSVKTDLSTQSGQVTVLVLDKDAVDTAVTADKILYIDQAAAGANIFQNMGLKNGALTAGTYKVKVGGTSIGDSIKVATITIADTPTYKLGAVTEGDSLINGADATLVLDYSAGNATLTANQLLAANVTVSTGDTVVNGADATDILDYSAGNPSYIAGTKTN